MFPLLRYFASASAVLLLLTVALVVALYRQTSFHYIVTHGEDTSVIIAKSLHTSLWPEFGPFLTSLTAPSDVPWITHPKKADLERLIGQQISGLSIHDVTIYNARGMAVFSTRNARIGQDAAADAAVRAALAGKTVTEWYRGHTGDSNSRAVEHVEVLSTAVPVIDQDGKVEAVIEVHADASAVMHHLLKNTQLFTLIMLLVFSALYIALLFFVHHANRTATRQHRQILAAKDELAERTAELHETQEDLLRKQRLASLGQMIGTIGHDLRNPLGVIRNSLTVIRQRSKQAGLDLERQLDRSERSINRCDGIIHDLLDHTRVPDLALQPAAIDAWLLALLDEQTPPEGIGLSCDLKAAGIQIALDPERFRRVVINIFDNACQAMAENPEGGKGRLTVATRVEGGRLEISFRDNGPGIDPELMTKIFEPLFTTKQQGVGLGLPMVKQIVELHGGVIHITSEKGQGTCVALRMPTRGAAEAAA